MNPDKKTLAVLTASILIYLMGSCGSSSGSSSRSVNPHAEAHMKMHQEFYEEEIAREHKEILDELAGSYSGTLPCRDCEGIQFVLTLDGDMTYHSRTEYLGKSGDPKIEEGTYALGENGVIGLIGSQSQWVYFKIEGNELRVLDENGKVIPGELGELYLLGRE